MCRSLLERISADATLVFLDVFFYFHVAQCPNLSVIWDCTYFFEMARVLTNITVL